MSNNTYLAVFLGSKTSAASKAWNALPESERQAKQKAGADSWRGWMQKHHAAVLEELGGPLGKTKSVTAKGIEDTSNQLSAFVLVRAESHEAAAKLFEKHPHFTIFPGDGVEIMPVLPIPGA
jgi:hypothetical protein